jgi:TrmH family RNA methyltransferase
MLSRFRVPAMSPPAVRRISSRQNPLVTRFRDTVRAGAGADVVIEGATLVREALDAGWLPTVLVLTEEAADSPEGAELARLAAASGEVVVVPARVMDAISPAAAPSGVVALASPRFGTIDDVFRPPPALAVLAVGVQDPGNLGAIVRVAEAAGATGVLACGQSAHPGGWRALRGSMGSAFRLPVSEAPVDAALRASRTHGVRIVALALGGTPMHRVDLRAPSALVVGAEGSGLPHDILDAADVVLTIPMRPPVASLNVAVAAGLALYEARRQRMPREQAAGATGEPR